MKQWNEANFEQNSVGIGLRLPLVKELLYTKPNIQFLEIIADNFFDPKCLAWKFLDELKSHYTIVVHSIGVNLLGAQDLNREYLQNLKRVADRVGAPLVSDHLCWCSLNEFHSYDLLPVPHMADLIPFASKKAAQIQDTLERPFALENLSAYLSFSQSEFSEWEFYNAIVKEAKCYYLLDVNNIYVSSKNLNFSPAQYLESIDYSKVAQIHLAGHEKLSNNFIVDTHDSPICAEVWDLYDWVCAHKGPFPVCVEWDDKIPNLESVLAEVQKASHRMGL